MENKNIIAIYQIKSIVNNKIYIGSTKNYASRVRSHKSTLVKGNHFNAKLQNHCNKYGIDDLVFSIIEILDDCGLLAEREQYNILNLTPSFNFVKRVLPNTHWLSLETLEKNKIKKIEDNIVKCFNLKTATIIDNLLKNVNI